MEEELEYAEKCHNLEKEFGCPLKQCEQILPLIKEFHEFDNRSYGYSAWEYNFVEDFIKVLEEVIKYDGKLLFL